MNEQLKIYELSLVVAEYSDRACTGDSLSKVAPVSDCGKMHGSSTDDNSQTVIQTQHCQGTEMQTTVVKASAAFTMQALREVAEIDAALFPGNVWGLSSYAKSAEQDYDFLIVAAGGAFIKGFALLRCMDDAELIRIAVRPEYRRQSIGRKLLNALTDETHRRDIHSIFLEVRSSNTAAAAMYEAAGFDRVGVRKAYYSNPQEDALIMRYTW